MKKLVILFCLIAQGCATIMSGTKQKVSIISHPSEAKISIDGKHVSGTPSFVILKRKKEYKLKVEKSGYVPYEALIKQSFNYWSLGNLIVGVWFFPVDGVTGSMWKFPDKLEIILTKAGH